MGATEEQLHLLANAGVSHVSYILLLYSISFLLFLFVCMLLHLYASYAWPLDPTQPKTKANGGLNGHVGHVDGRVRDAEEFELEGLMSDDEAQEDGVVTPARKRANGTL